MRFLIVISFLLNFFGCFSQIRMALAMPEYNIVYRGYNNMLAVSTRTKLNPEYIELNCEGALLQHREDNEWILNPFTTSDSLEIRMIHSKTKEIIDRFVYRVRNLPDPQLFVGAAENGGKISRVELRLFARYTNSPLKAEFTVKEAFVVVEGYSNVFVTNKNKLGIDYQEVMKNVPEGAKVKIKAIAIGPDGLEHVIYGEYFY